jgi:hypothetical protein
MRVPRLAALVAAALLLTTATAFAAFDALPGDGSQVNNDASAGIDPSKDVGLSDVTAGSLTGGLAVPWGTFEQKTSGSQQVFVRAFNAGSWATEGHGTVNGSGGSTPFAGSLNFDQSQEAKAPSIDFAGSGRAVPWATWYEPNGLLGGAQQIFASRFDQAQDKWVFAGQGRGPGPFVPSLNIDSSQNAANPSVAGGSTNPANPPGPWITWEEAANNGVSTTSQIFVVKPVKLDPGVTTCPGGTKPAGAGLPVGGFCWQQTGIERVSGNTKPSLNVDITRQGVEPDIAFTGPNETVPWAVWYEQGAGQFSVANERVFAAKGISGSGDGGITWQAVGNGTSGKPAQILDASGGGGCIADINAENACSLNNVSGVDAEDPRVAAGTMTSGSATVPWVVWDEDVAAVKQIFVSRLVGGDHFVLANSGQPLSVGASDSTRPDITFSGNTPYVSWRKTTGVNQARLFVGHFVNAANPTFVLDTPSGINVSTAGAVLDLRAPISSGCTANPTNSDGAACQGGALGTPFFLFADGLPGAQKLFARAYSPEGVTTSAASGVTQTSATLNGSVNPAGAPVTVHFDFGPSPSYGSSTAAQTLGAATSATGFSAALTGLAPSTTIHFRAVAQSDFGTFTGGDQVLTTAAVPTPTPTPTNDEPHSKIKGLKGKVKAKKLKGFHGTASDNDGVARVQIALVGFKSGAHVSAKRRGTCLLLQSSGRLKSSKADRKNRCTQRKWLTAKGTATWTFKLKKKLSKGRYVLFSRAVDRKAKLESHFSAKRGNRVTFKVT